jgi:hypothetical protein
MKDAILIIVLSSGLMIGSLYGVMHGQARERETIANECRTANAFTFRRTGFECRAMK